MVEEQEINDKPPEHITADWNFFLHHLNRESIEIPAYFGKENWKINTVYRMRVSHVYDPSHFWVVSRETEVDALHKYLHDFYSKYKNHYKIPTKHFKPNMYCVTYTEDAFYRSVLVNVPLTIEAQSWAFVFLIDFGFMAKVSLDEVYFMTKDMFSIPQFAIRASLSGLGPVGTKMWSSTVVSRFNTLVCNKILLCQVTNRNYVEKILYLRLGEYNWQTKNVESINDRLVIERLAKQMSLVDVREIKHANKKKGMKRRKLPFLSPTFEEIEKAICSDAVSVARYLDEFTCN